MRALKARHQALPPPSSPPTSSSPAPPPPAASSGTPGTANPKNPRTAESYPAWRFSRRETGLFSGARIELLGRDGIEVGRDVVEIVVEAVVGKLKTEKTDGRGAGLSDLAPDILNKAGALLGLERKQGVLITRGAPEPSLALELIKTKGKSWLSSGWSLDAITTPDRGGLGIAKDLFKADDIEVDLGAYVTQDYRAMFQKRFDPALGVGLSVRFCASSWYQPVLL